MGYSILANILIRPLPKGECLIAECLWVGLSIGYMVYRYFYSETD
ncbi:hypothetical protein [Candidatus Williamhamiltonella defendens]|nr:hypothetical protein [Candidatus Hamiltonella defensa]